MTKIRVAAINEYSQSSTSKQVVQSFRAAHYQDTCAHTFQVKYVSQHAVCLSAEAESGFREATKPWACQGSNCSLLNQWLRHPKPQTRAKSLVPQQEMTLKTMLKICKPRPSAEGCPLFLKLESTKDSTRQDLLCQDNKAHILAHTHTHTHTHTVRRPSSSSH